MFSERIVNHEDVIAVVEITRKSQGSGVAGNRRLKRTSYDICDGVDFIISDIMEINVIRTAFIANIEDRIIDWRPERRSLYVRIIRQASQKSGLQVQFIDVELCIIEIDDGLTFEYGFIQADITSVGCKEQAPAVGGPGRIGCI